MDQTRDRSLNANRKKRFYKALREAREVNAEAVAGVQQGVFRRVEAARRWCGLNRASAMALGGEPDVVADGERFAGVVGSENVVFLQH
jgi:hypothetical protein